MSKRKPTITGVAGAESAGFPQEKHSAYEIQRRTLENKIDAKLRALLTKAKLELVEHLGDPPRLARVPNEYWQTLESRVYRAVKPHLVQAYKLSTHEEAQEWKIKPPKTRLDREARAWAHEVTEPMAADFVEHTRQWLKESIAVAKQKRFEESPEAGNEHLRDSINSMFGKARAVAVAVTTVVKARTDGQKASVDQYEEETGDELEGIWVCVGKPCDRCGPLNGTGPEVWGREFPGGPPSPHPHCRCKIVYRLKRKAA